MITITDSRLPRRCPACHERLETHGLLASCERCHTVHHAECLEELKCASFGCVTPADKSRRAGVNTENPIIQAIINGAIRAYDDHGSYVADDPTDADYIEIPYTEGWRCWDESLVRRANFLAICDDIGHSCPCDRIGDECPHTASDYPSECELYRQGEGSVEVRVLTEPCGCMGDHEGVWACENRYLEWIQELENYHLLDESLHSRLEMATVTEHLEDRGYQEALDSLDLGELESEALDDAEGQLGDKEFWSQVSQAFYDACEETGDYPECQDDCWVNMPHTFSYGYRNKLWKDAFYEALGFVEAELWEDDEDDE